MILAPSGLPGGALGGLLGGLLGSLRPSWVVLGRLGGFLGELGGILDPLGPSWRPSWTILGGLGGHLGPSWRPSWANVAILEAILSRLGGFFGELSSWAIFPGPQRDGPKPHGEFFWKKNQNQDLRSPARQAPLR